MTDQLVRIPANQLFSARLLIGLVQGLALYLLYSAHDDRTWPATSGYLFAPLLTLSLFIPLVALQGLGNLRMRTLLIWIGSAALLLVAFTLYDIWRAWPVEWVYDEVAATSSRGIGLPRSGSWLPILLPSVSFLLTLSPVLFVTHALVSAGDSDRRVIADYPTYFDIAWKLAVQLCLSAAFLAVFWMFLFLGSALFRLIGLDFFQKLIEHRWFAIPATALALSAAIHITDVRANLIRGTRTLVHTLLSWLMPLLTLILSGFLLALIFTGLQPLWSTGSATTLLILSAAASVLLVNATYQDGKPERDLPFLLRHAGTLAALLLTPLVALATYALGLRINQYGWTADRVLAAAVVAIVAFYAAGYAAAVFRPGGGWLKPIERWNVYAAFFSLALFLILFGPIVDPMRIAVADQMAHLHDGETAPEDFDFAALRLDGGRFGKKALEGLTANGPSANFQARAEKAIALKNWYNRPNFDRDVNLADHANVYPAEKQLPSSFIEQDWESAAFSVRPNCTAIHNCDLYVVDLDGDNVDEVLDVTAYSTVGFRVDEEGHWDSFGYWKAEDGCAPSLQGFLAHKPKLLPPRPSPWPDIDIDGKLFVFSPPVNHLPCKRSQGR
ncbi:DUF4153 domain-containing protein [Parvibaculum sp.]|uniref:DUF4153 domain-containing protein n=1 Tax=Parvibaculum sp. TaxID=2024848 RepID=UPI0025EBB63D|nr:DUF4153 domain-containing protein [Parvibaculum sp.]